MLSLLLFLLLCHALQMLLLSTDKGTLVDMQVEVQADGSVTSKVVSQVTAAVDPLSSKLGTTGGASKTAVMLVEL